METKLAKQNDFFGWFLTIAIFTTVTLLSVIVVRNYHSNIKNALLWKRDFETIKLKGNIIHLDEVLTMSARMAAETGNTNWEKRYRFYEIKLDSAINKIKENVPTALIGEFVQSTDSANTKLVEMENRAFNLIHKNQIVNAQSVLFSDEYEKQKGIYKAGMDHLASNLDDFLKERQNAVEKSFYSELWLMGFIILILLSGWLFVFRFTLQSKNELGKKVRVRTAELSKVNEELIKQDELLNETSALAKVGGWEINLSDMTMHWTDEVFRIHELKPGRMAPVEEGINYYAPEARPIIQEAVNKAITQGEGFNLELPLITAKGKHLWVLAIGKAEMKNGKVDRVFGVFQDITERKNAEEELRKLSQAVEQSPATVVITDTTGNIEYINPKFTQTTGYTFEEALGKNLRILKSGHTSCEEYEELWESITHDKSWKGEFQNKKKNGELYWESAIISPIFNIKGEIINFLAIKEDITERKKGEENLKQSELRFQEFFENSPVAISVFDPASLKFVSNNISAVKLFGFSDKELQNKGLNDISPEFQPDGRSSEEKVKELILKALNGEKPDFEWVYCDGDGNKILCETRLAMLSSVGAPLILASTLNITERKNAEKRLKDQNKELQKTNTELDHFVYSTSHDLRSPLTSVLGLVGFIEDETKEADTLEHAHMIRARVKRLDDFVINILNYSRNNRLHIIPVLINFNDIIEQTIKGLQHIQEAKKIRFEINVDAITPFYTDLQRIITIFENQIGNAIKYYDPKQKKPFVSIHVNTTPDHAEISIEDNGIGIAKEHQLKIFDMFYRVSSAAPGSGLGLYLVKEIIDKLEGTISLQSEIGCGSKFTVTLKNFNDGKNN